MRAALFAQTQTICSVWWCGGIYPGAGQQPGDQPTSRQMCPCGSPELLSPVLGYCDTTCGAAHRRGRIWACDVRCANCRLPVSRSCAVLRGSVCSRQDVWQRGQTFVLLAWFYRPRSGSGSCLARTKLRFCFGTDDRCGQLHWELGYWELHW
jgi:hypothetical protein